VIVVPTGSIRFVSSPLKDSSSPERTFQPQVDLRTFIVDDDARVFVVEPDQRTFAPVLSKRRFIVPVDRD